MLTESGIHNLITSPKEIKEKIPARGYKEENNYKRCDLKLETTTMDRKSFLIFIRQNATYIDNFSIGLRYKTEEKTQGFITLVRYNGPHGETGLEHANHHAHPHIHRITATEIASGSIQPQESHRKITNRYGTFETALKTFFDDVKVANYAEYFVELNQGVRPFNGH